MLHLGQNEVKMTQLSVNVNKVATLRNARGKNTPDVIQVSRDVISYGAHGITIHPRPDQRHIRNDDVYLLSDLIASINDEHQRFKGEAQLPAAEEALKVEFNIEGYPSKKFLKMIGEVRPDQCTLVPDPPDVITSNAGWDPIADQASLTDVVGQLRSLGVRSSLFIDPLTTEEKEIEALVEIRPDRVELFTERYAEAFATNEQEEITDVYARVAEKLHDLEVEVNAGHDLSLNNIEFLISRIPCIKEVSIGHALISEALYLGLEATVKEYLKKMKWSL